MRIRSEWHYNETDARHSIVFEHHTLSGKRVLFVDGEKIYETGWRYKLTGSVVFPVGRLSARLTIRPKDFSDLEYKLAVNGVPVSSKSSGVPRAKLSRWEIKSDAGDIAVVDFNHDTMDIFVMDKRVEAEADFLEEGSGSQYAFNLPDGREAHILIRPAKRGTTAELQIHGKHIPEEGEDKGDAEQGDGSDVAVVGGAAHGGGGDK